jgi:hypothetical protein
VTGPADDGGVYTMVQKLVANVQEALELKLPPAPPSLHAIVPVGLVFVPKALSATTALKVNVFPIVTVEGFGVTVVEVERRVTVNADVPELPACETLPE